MPPPIPPRTIPKKAVAPGSVPASPPSKAGLNPKPKPVGPPKGGAPGMHTKVPRPARPMTPVIKGENMGGHPRSHHTTITQSEMADRLRGMHPKAPPSRPGAAPKTVTKWNSPADEKRAARAVAKDPNVQAAMKQVAAARPGTPGATAQVTVPTRPGKGPTMQVMRAPGGPPRMGSKPPVTTERAASIPVKITKTDQGIGYRTMFGKPGPTAKKP